MTFILAAAAFVGFTIVVAKVLGIPGRGK